MLRCHVQAAQSRHSGEVKADVGRDQKTKVTLALDERGLPSIEIFGDKEDESRIVLPALFQFESWFRDRMPSLTTSEDVIMLV